MDAPGPRGTRELGEYDPCPFLRIRVLMHELHAILRTSHEPWQPLVFWGFLLSIFRAKRSSALSSSSCQRRPDARTKETHSLWLSFPSARNVQPMVHCSLCYPKRQPLLAARKLLSENNLTA